VDVFIKGRHDHSHTLNHKPMSLGSKVKGYSLYVESEDLNEAISALENALLKLKNGEVMAKESGVMVDGVRASYCYPYRPHCAMIADPFWDE